MLQFQLLLKEAASESPALRASAMRPPPLRTSTTPEPSLELVAEEHVAVKFDDEPPADLRLTFMLPLAPEDQPERGPCKAVAPTDRFKLVSLSCKDDMTVADLKAQLAEENRGFVHQIAPRISDLLLVAVFSIRNVRPFLPAALARSSLSDPAARLQPNKDVALQDHHYLKDLMRVAEAKLMRTDLRWTDVRCLYVDSYHVPQAWNAAILSKYCISAVVAALGPSTLPWHPRQSVGGTHRRHCPARATFRQLLVVTPRPCLVRQGL